MENKPLYPPITKKQRRRQHLAYVLNRIFVTCVILSIIVNLASGGAPWCLIVISQTIKAIILLSILFILIDLLYPGWAGVATSVLLCCGIVLSAALFFSDFRRQRENLFPFLWLLIVALARALTGVTSTSGPIRASFVLMAALSLILVLLFILFLRKDCLRELRCRFHLR